MQTRDRESGQDVGALTGSREPSPSSSTAGLGPSGFDPARIGHTPGRWWGAILAQHPELGRSILDEFSKSFNPAGWASVTDGGEQFIAWIATTPETIMEDAANVALIQAAPDLLIACRASLHGERGAEDLMRAAIARTDSRSVLPASCDTHRNGEDAPQSAAEFMGSAVPKADAPIRDAQPLGSGNSNEE